MEIAQWFAPFGFSVNTLLMPLLWLFVRYNFDKSFRFGWKHALHFLPAILCFVYTNTYLWSMPQVDRLAFIEYENTGKDNLIGNINSIIVFTQMFVYFTGIFVYLYRVKKYVKNHYSQAEWEYKLWIPKFMILVAVLFVIVFVAYIIWPRTDAWLIQIINVLSMSYLVYGSLVESNAPQVANISMKNVAEAKKEAYGNNALAKSNTVNPQIHNEDEQELQRLKIFAMQVQEYLTVSEAFLKTDLSIQDVARATGIASNNISRAINQILHRNFFELINKMRCEKAKTMLSRYRESNLTMDGLAQQCGFNSRFTLNASFKKAEGVSPSVWIKEHEK